MNVQKLIEKAKDAGIENIEVYTQKTKEETLNVYDQKVDNFTIAQSGGISVRGIYEGKMGCFFLEEDSDDYLDLCIEKVIENAKSIENDDQVFIYEGSEHYQEVEMIENTMMDGDVQKKIDFLMQVEKKLLESDERIAQVMQTQMECSEVEVHLVNSRGLDLTRKQAMCMYYAFVLASDKEDNKSGMDWRFVHNFEECDVDEFVESLKKKVLGKLNASQVVSGKYPVIMKNEAMAALLEAFSGLFNGENVYKGLSKLKDKLNTAVFDEKITIIDNPLMKDGISSTSFDDEGVACMEKKVVEKGVLKMFLHNLKSAAVMNTVSTGNGFKSGYAGSVGISPTNFYIASADDSFEALCHKMKDGLIIEDLEGLHAGLNPISADFSLQASGYLVENGQVVHPVNLITVAGNFLEMMKEVEAVGKDTYTSYSGIGSPSIFFKNLSISGK